MPHAGQFVAAWAPATADHGDLAGHGPVSPPCPSSARGSGPLPRQPEGLGGDRAGPPGAPTSRTSRMRPPRSGGHDRQPAAAGPRTAETDEDQPPGPSPSSTSSIRGSSPPGRTTSAAVRRHPESEMPAPRTSKSRLDDIVRAQISAEERAGPARARRQSPHQASGLTTSTPPRPSAASVDGGRRRDRDGGHHRPRLGQARAQAPNGCSVGVEEDGAEGDARSRTRIGPRGG